jgi:hypothetical protein
MCSFIGIIEAEAMLGRGRNLLEVVAEPAMGLIDVQDTVGGLALCGICGEQAAEAGLRRGRVCFEAEADLG